MMLNDFITAKNNKETRYQGKPCLRGHSGVRYTISGNCTQCKSYKPTGRKAGSTPNPFRLKAIQNNEKYYHTGKPCRIAGHLSKRLTTNSRCEACFEIYLKTKRREREKGYDLKKKYGITLAQYNEMLEKQSGVCKICKQPEKSMNGNGRTLKPLAVDHCHETGRIRALLCSRCNIGIGSLKHNPELLRIAALYCEEI